jgi:hypothetical protein
MHKRVAQMMNQKYIREENEDKIWLSQFGMEIGICFNFKYQALNISFFIISSLDSI